MNIRPYQSTDYEQIAALYRQSELYGGQFDENRDSEERLQKRVEADPDAILVAEENAQLLGTVSLIEDGRVAWLFRFAVQRGEQESEVTKALSNAAVVALKARGHNQVLVYTPVGNDTLNSRYEALGFNRGSDYTCYWKDINHMGKTIVLISQKPLWEQAQSKGVYAQSTITSTLEEVGFIHGTFPDQTMDVLPRFKDMDEIILLLVDADQVTVPIKYEAALSGRPGTFPHIYGPLNTDAVYKVVILEKDENGEFVEPEELRQAQKGRSR